MTFRTLTAACLATSLATTAWAVPNSQDPARVPPGEYVLDKSHASLVVKVAHMGFSGYTMRFDRLEGTFTYDPAAWTTTKATITVDPASISTGQPSFDRQIAGSQFLDAARYPAITFTTKALSLDAEGRGRIDGELTFHGVTRPVTLEATFNGVGSGMLGVGTRLGVSGHGRIKRSEFGVDAVSSLVGDDVDLAFEVEFTRK